ncbi:MAG: HD domain-containing protein [Anaerolineales bacterium]|nr:HD domain-containing protein [Anaerolineales bacterium]
MPTIDQAREWYSHNDQVHDFDHVLRVFRLAEVLAEKEGADIEIVRAAALLHDAESASGNENTRLTHHEAAAAFAGKVLQDEGWPKDRILAVQECILSHRFRAGEAPQSLEAKILFDADKLDAIGAIGVARSFAYAVLDRQPLYAQPSPIFLQTLKTEPGEAYTAYHEYLFKLSKIKDRIQTKSGRKMAEERHNFMKNFFDHLNAEVQGVR